MAGVHELTKLTGLKQQEIIDVFDAVLNLARSKQRVIIRGFGSFWVVTRPPRTVVSTALKKGRAEVPEAKVLRFRASKETRRVVKARAKAKPTEKE